MITRSLDLSRVRRHFQKRLDKQRGRQTDKIFKMTFELAVSISQCLRLCLEMYKNAKKRLCDGWMDRQTNGSTDGPKSGL